MSGDASNGAKLFKARCAQCHTYTKKGPNKQGPNLWGIIGRTAGTVPGYNYSRANQESGVEWSEENLFDYLKAPKKYIRGTRMAFPGLKKSKDRNDVIAFMRENCQ